MNNMLIVTPSGVEMTTSNLFATLPYTKESLVEMYKKTNKLLFSESAYPSNSGRVEQLEQGLDLLAKRLENFLSPDQVLMLYAEANLEWHLQNNKNVN
jgi:hypothetical protein